MYFIRVLNYFDLCCSCKKLLLRWFLSIALLLPYVSLHSIFVSLVCANERVHKNNKRNFPQAKLHGKINACLLFKWAQRPIFFLLHNNSVHIILFNSKQIQKFLSGRKEDIGESVHKIGTLACKLWPQNWTLYIHVILNGVIFPQILYVVLYMLDTFYLSSFFPKYYLISSLHPATAKCNGLMNNMDDQHEHGHKIME